METKNRIKVVVSAIFKALWWLSRYFLASMFALPLLTLFAMFFDIDFITNSIKIYEDVQSVTAGVYINPEHLRIASNVLLSAGLLSYIPILMMMFNRNEAPGGYRKIEINKLFKYLCLGMGLNLVAQYTIGIATTIQELAQHTNELEAVNNNLLSGHPLMVILVVGVLGPMVEEITLRRGVQKNLCKINPVFGVIASSILFGWMHGNLLQGAAAAIMGFGLGYIYYKTDNLWYPTILHMTINLDSVFNMLVKPLGISTILLPAIFGLLYIATKEDTPCDVATNEITKEDTNNKKPIKVKVKKIKQNSKQRTIKTGDDLYEKH